MLIVSAFGWWIFKEPHIHIACRHIPAITTAIFDINEELSMAIKWIVIDKKQVKSPLAKCLHLFTVNLEGGNNRSIKINGREKKIIFLSFIKQVLKPCAHRDRDQSIKGSQLNHHVMDEMNKIDRRFLNQSWEWVDEGSLWKFSLFCAILLCFLCIT